QGEALRRGRARSQAAGGLRALRGDAHRRRGPVLPGPLGRNASPFHSRHPSCVPAGTRTERLRGDGRGKPARFRSRFLPPGTEAHQRKRLAAARHSPPYGAERGGEDRQHGGQLGARVDRPGGDDLPAQISTDTAAYERSAADDTPGIEIERKGSQGQSLANSLCRKSAAISAGTARLRKSRMISAQAKRMEFSTISRSRRLSESSIGAQT